MAQQLPQTYIQPAATGRRFMNFLIDWVLIAISEFFIAFVETIIFGRSLTGNFWFSFASGYLITFLYYFMFETLFLKTPGKFLTGTKVIMDDGSEPDIATIAKRTLSRLVPFEIISAYTGNLSGKKGTWWHDRWTGTRVVSKTTDPETNYADRGQSG